MGGGAVDLPQQAAEVVGYSEGGGGCLGLFWWGGLWIGENLLTLWWIFALFVFFVVFAVFFRLFWVTLVRGFIMGKF